MAEALGRCQEELVKMKSTLAGIVNAGGMRLSNEQDIQAMSVVGEYLTKLIDNVGTAVEASKKGFEDVERKQNESSQVVGLRGSSIQSVQAEMAILRSNQQFGNQQQSPKKITNILDSKSIQGIKVFSHDKSTSRT